MSARSSRLSCSPPPHGESPAHSGSGHLPRCIPKSRRSAMVPWTHIPPAWQECLYPASLSTLLQNDTISFYFCRREKHAKPPFVKSIILCLSGKDFLIHLMQKESPPFGGSSSGWFNILSWAVCLAKDAGALSLGAFILDSRHAKHSILYPTLLLVRCHCDH